MGRQSVVRLLDALVIEGMAVKGSTSKRYGIAPKIYHWGTRVAGKYQPNLFVRHEIANLAEELRHPVLYHILDSGSVITIEWTTEWAPWS